MSTRKIKVTFDVDTTRLEEQVAKVKADTSAFAALRDVLTASAADMEKTMRKVSDAINQTTPVAQEKVDRLAASLAKPVVINPNDRDQMRAIAALFEDCPYNDKHGAEDGFACRVSRLTLALREYQRKQS